MGHIWINPGLFLEAMRHGNKSKIAIFERPEGDFRVLRRLRRTMTGLGNGMAQFDLHIVVVLPSTQYLHSALSIVPRQPRRLVLIPLEAGPSRWVHKVIETL